MARPLRARACRNSSASRLSRSSTWRCSWRSGLLRCCGASVLPVCGGALPSTLDGGRWALLSCACIYTSRITSPVLIRFRMLVRRCIGNRHEELVAVCLALCTRHQRSKRAGFDMIDSVVFKSRMHLCTEASCYLSCSRASCKLLPARCTEQCACGGVVLCLDVHVAIANSLQLLASGCAPGSWLLRSGARPRCLWRLAPAGCGLWAAGCRASCKLCVRAMSGSLGAPRRLLVVGGPPPSLASSPTPYAQATMLRKEKSTIVEHNRHAVHLSEA